MIDVKKIASLSRIQLKPGEEEKIGQQLKELMLHFEKIQNVDTGGISPITTPTLIENLLREDRVLHALSQDEALANAPDKIGSLFKVPPVVG